MVKKPLPKWWMVPPIVALLLILGPLSMQGPATPATNTANTAKTPTVTAPAADTGKADRTPSLPRTPDFWQIGSTLLGVLVLGVAGVFGLRRLRGGARPTGGTTIVTLRQSLRLTQRSTLHAVEFDDRILLVGESDKGITLLEAGRSTTRAADELQALATAASLMDTVEVEDEGAVPKDLLIPRPTKPPAPKPPTQPVLPRPTTVPAAPARAPRGLGDFRALLQKVGRQ